ncbi:MAG: membrane protein insertion efficiency factor YidD [Acidimicrobiia bacterium]|nr:membrane protein insertion efficiency factor YidD [Acidimicrobiia bacterium]
MNRELRPYHLAWWIRLVVRGYQRALSPFLGRNCRYHPTCSSYMIGAVETHGAARGTWMGMKRIGRCHPWREGGFDPVPPSGDAA